LHILKKIGNAKQLITFLTQVNGLGVNAISSFVTFVIRCTHNEIPNFHESKIARKEIASPDNPEITFIVGK